MNGQKRAAWFPAKRYGIGWGLPNCWQGWVVMAAWVLLVGVGTVLLRPDVHPVAYVVYDTILTALLLVIIVAKGERMRWRWGNDSDPKPGL
jgi:hypothetical protein